VCRKGVHARVLLSAVHSSIAICHDVEPSTSSRRTVAGDPRQRPLVHQGSRNGKSSPVRLNSRSARPSPVADLGRNERKHMPQQMAGVLVLIASPGDTVDERIAVSEALADWNVIRGRRQGSALLGWRYDKHAVARLGGRPQEIINEQAVNQSDVVVAFFDSRLGTNTGVDVSGTAEEINKAADAGKPVHVYFSQEDLPRDVDTEQIEALKAFQDGLRDRGLLGYYTSPADLADQVVRALEHDLETEGWADDAASNARSKPGGAELRWEHERAREAKGLDRKGKMAYRTTRNHLIVSNEGRAAAEGLTFTVEPINDTMFHFDAVEKPFDLGPRSQMAWRLIAGGGWGNTGSNVLVKAHWHEGDQVKVGEWTVTLNS
jgi:hypothetical protein